MSLQKNKKGADKLISIYWFMILTIIAGGVVMMVNGYYSGPYDVREVEGDIFASKLANCIYPAGTANPNFVSVQGIIKPEFIENFESHCKLNIEPEGEFEKAQYYAKITFYRTEKKKSEEQVIEIGNKNFLVDCKSKDTSKNLATCVENEFWMMFPGDRLKFVTVLTAIGKTDQNA